MRLTVMAAAADVAGTVYVADDSAICALAVLDALLLAVGESVDVGVVVTSLQAANTANTAHSAERLRVAFCILMRWSSDQCLQGAWKRSVDAALCRSSETCSTCRKYVTGNLRDRELLNEAFRRGDSRCGRTVNGPFSVHEFVM